MSKILRPRRGKHEYATSQNIKLAKGELFLSYTDEPFTTNNIYNSINRLYLGDGSTSFSNLKPFLSNEPVSTASNGMIYLPNDISGTKYLRGDGTWTTPPDNNTTYNTSTVTNNTTFNNRIGVIDLTFNNLFMLNQNAPCVIAPSSFVYNNTTYNKTTVTCRHFGYFYYNMWSNDTFYSGDNINAAYGASIHGYAGGKNPPDIYMEISDDVMAPFIICCGPGKYLATVYQSYVNNTTVDRVCNCALYSTTATDSSFEKYSDFLNRPRYNYDSKVSYFYIDTSNESANMRYFTIGGRNEGGTLEVNDLRGTASHAAQGAFRLTMIKFN